MMAAKIKCKMRYNGLMKTIKETLSSKDGILSSTRVAMAACIFTSCLISIATTYTVCKTLLKWTPGGVDISHIAPILSEMAILVGALLAPICSLKYFQTKEELKNAQNNGDDVEKTPQTPLN